MPPVEAVRGFVGLGEATTLAKPVCSRRQRTGTGQPSRRDVSAAEHRGLAREGSVATGPTRLGIVACFRRG